MLFVRKAKSPNEKDENLLLSHFPLTEICEVVLKHTFLCLCEFIFMLPIYSRIIMVGKK